jgi:histidyl-tRNA synthetase
MSKETIFSTAPYKGTRDFYPTASLSTPGKSNYFKERQNHIKNTIEKVLVGCGFDEYSSSVLEYSDVFKQKSGEELASRALYEFTDRGDRQIALRPELTLGLSRVIAGQFDNLRFPLRWFSWDNCFRYERPQKGRLREFWQMEVDIVGLEAGAVDYEVIFVLGEIFRAFGADKNMYSIQYNHRGLMDLWIAKNGWQGFAGELFAVIDNWVKLDETARGIDLRKILDNQKDVQKITNTMNRIGEDFAEYEKLAEGFVELDLIKKNLQSVDLPIQFCPWIVRGQSYYTGLVFECFDKNNNNPRSLFGGGRFDNLLDLFGKSVPAIGFAPGDVSMHEFLTNWNLYPDVFTSQQKIGILPMSEKSLVKMYQEIIPKLQKQGQAFDIDYSYERSLNKRQEALLKRDCSENILVE